MIVMACAVSFHQNTETRDLRVLLNPIQSQTVKKKLSLNASMRGFGMLLIIPNCINCGEKNQVHLP